MAIRRTSRSVRTSLRWLISSVSLTRADALGEQAADELANRLRCRRERGDVVGGADRGAHALQRQALHREQVALADHVDDAAVLRHRQMADAVARHRHDGVVRRVVDAHRPHGRRHDGAHRRRQRDAGQRHAVEDVVPGEYPFGAAFVVEDEHRSGTPIDHHRQCLLQRSLGFHGHQTLALQRAERPFQRLLGEGARRVRRLPALSRRLEVVHGALLEKARERRTLRGQPPDLLCGKQQAEAVLAGGEGRFHRSLERGAERKKVAGLVFDRFPLAPAFRDAAATDEVNGRRGSVSGREDTFAGREVGLPGSCDEGFDAGALHLREWRVADQLGGQGLHQAGRGRRRHVARCCRPGIRPPCGAKARRPSAQREGRQLGRYRHVLQRRVHRQAAAVSRVVLARISGRR